jgi:hypothetical protein
MFAQLFWYIAIGLLLAVFTDFLPDNMLIDFYTVVAITVVFSVWLMIFNSGKTKIIEHGLELTEEGITYINYGDMLTIKWSSFVGFNIKNRFPRLILLKSSDNRNIEFSYYVFSSAQRRELFGYLRDK